MDTSSPRRLWPAVVTTTKEEARKINEAVRNGELRPLGLKLFTPNFSDSDEKVIKDNLWRVVGLLAPGAVVSYRTAIEGKPTENDTVFLVGNSRYERKIPGLNLRVNKGPGPQASDRPFIGGLFLASRPRALLEALKPSRERGGVRKGLFEREVESVLEREFEAGGEQKLNAIRDQARDLAPLLSADAEFKRLDRLIGVLLGSRTGATTNRSATARLSGNAYDPGRFSLFQKLFEHLVANPGHSRPAEINLGWENISFFDAYFSNFIEGTEFEVEEAREIVFESKIPEARPEDAHDILGTYAAASDKLVMSTSILSDPNAQSFIDRLRDVHRLILESRVDKRPGEFKQRPNRAGETHFVEPHLVEGTLVQAFEIARAIADPFNRAAAVMFFISEVHPFDDGNGRVARIFMNAELVSDMQTRIIIPSVFREEYLTGLRVLTRQQRPNAFLEVLDFAQKYVSEIDWSSYERAETLLRSTKAFEEPQPHIRLRLPSSVRL